MTDSGRAVFLSYASQDAEAAQRICEGLRAAGIEVWLDQSELRGGDAWDLKIRQQIRDCALFVPIISVNTASRLEGYFRLEWKLAVDRSHLMAAEKPFLLPVVVDATQESNAHVPDRFREVQWTRLLAGQHTPAFVEHVRRLLYGEQSQEPLQNAAAAARRIATRGAGKPVLPWWRSKAALLTTIAVAIVILGYAWNRLLPSTRVDVAAATAPAVQNSATTVAAFNPPTHSIAVLPFVNLSGDKDQEYFSDGLTEELLNSLAEIEGLQVAARTSAFSFKGQDNDIGTIARKLNVGAVLEGSVRRSAHTIRITAQLINAITGFHLWSKSYDRDLGDVLKLQTEIATAVANSLKVTLLGDVAAKVELGGTRNPAAFNAYLWGSKESVSRHELENVPAALAAYTEAIRLDPHYALAIAGRSIVLSYGAAEAATPAAAREGFDRAHADAQKAVALAPDLAQAHLALATVLELGTLDFTRANEEYERALILAPGNAQVLRISGLFATYMGHIDAGLAAARRAVVLDPLARDSHSVLGRALYAARRYAETIDALSEGLKLDPDNKAFYTYRGFAYYGLGDLESALTSCETNRDYAGNQWCLAVTYDKLGKHADAEVEILKLKASFGDVMAYQYAAFYAQRGDSPKALEWLETALRLRDAGLESLRTDSLMDPIRRELRFQAVMRELKFPI
ncbi:MAG TPA: TIR domain-containing protein [Steroidobacteraceae bacterium]|nr:TIR domain-containing protein [Steroidobacteraceae bacterium]